MNDKTLTDEQIDAGVAAYSAVATPAWSSNKHRPGIAAALRAALASQAVSAPDEFERGFQAGEAHAVLCGLPATAVAAPEPSEELMKLRADQASMVMPLIGPLLDAWEGLGNDLAGDEELDEIRKCVKAIGRAMEGTTEFERGRQEGMREVHTKWQEAQMEEQVAQAVAAPEPSEALSDDELNDLSHSACEEALSMGLASSVFLRYFKTIRIRALASQAPPAAPTGRGTDE